MNSGFVMIQVSVYGKGEIFCEKVSIFGHFGVCVTVLSKSGNIIDVWS